MKRITIIYFALILIIPVLLQAQYLGGNGRGDVMLELLNTPLTDAENNSITIPTSYSLEQNYPNPFNPVTKISFDIPKTGLITLSIYDISGKEVKTLFNEVRAPGTYTVDFDGTEISSGMYFCKMESGSFVKTIKLILVK